MRRIEAIAILTTLFSFSGCTSGLSLSRTAADAKVIGAGNASPRDIINYVTTVLEPAPCWGEDKDDASSTLHLLELLQQAMKGNLEEKSKAHHLTARLFEKNPAKCKQHLLQALEYADSKEDKAAVLCSLIQLPIGLTPNEDFHFRMELLRHTAAKDNALDMLAASFVSLWHQKRYQDIVKLWNRKELKSWHDEPRSKQFGATFGRHVYAKALFQLGKTKEALVEFRLVQRLRPSGQYWNTGETHFWEAQCLAELGQDKAARRTMARALENFRRGFRVTPEVLRDMRKKRLREAEEYLKQLRKESAQPDPPDPQ